MSGKARFSRLLKPGKLGRVKTKNRIVRSGAGIAYLDEEYFVKLAESLSCYRAMARGGVGLIILGGVLVEFPLGAVHPGQMRFDDDRFLPGYKEITDVVHKYGCPIFLQIHHAGACARPRLIIDAIAVDSVISVTRLLPDDKHPKWVIGKGPQ